MTTDANAETIAASSVCETIASETPVKEEKHEDPPVLEEKKEAVS